MKTRLSNVLAGSLLKEELEEEKNAQPMTVEYEDLKVLQVQLAEIWSVVSELPCKRKRFRI